MIRRAVFWVAGATVAVSIAAIILASAVYIAAVLADACGVHGYWWP